VRASVKATLSELHLRVKEQLHAVLSVYVDTQIGRYPPASKVYEKVRASQQDEALKLKIIKTYNEKMNTLPEKYYSEFDLPVVMDLFLDIFRHKRVQQVIIDSAFIIKEAKKVGLDNYKLQSFLKKFVAGDSFENIFNTLIS
jgi:hypothetical protein